MFDVGQWVWLRLIHRPAASIDITNRSKLGLKYFRPFQVPECIGDVAYHLQLSASARLHNIFHGGVLKPYHGETPTAPGILPLIKNGCACSVPAEVVCSRLARGTMSSLFSGRDCMRLMPAGWS
jgi:hypothetical protein